MMQASKLRDICRLAEIKEQSALLDMRRETTRLQALKAKIAGLTDIALPACSRDDFAQVAGNLDNWISWRATRLSVMRVELHAQARKIEDVKQVARTAHAKCQAVKKLLARSNQERAALQARRQSDRNDGGSRNH